MEYYDPRERALEKEKTRLKDEEDLKSGKVSVNDLRLKNGFFSSLDIKNSYIKRPSSLDETLGFYPD